MRTCIIRTKQNFNGNQVASRRKSTQRSEGKSDVVFTNVVVKRTYNCEIYIMLRVTAVAIRSSLTQVSLA